MAASSQALPGYPLYTVKLRIEELRVKVLPVEFRDELAVSALAERIEEMAQLAASGATAEAVALVRPIERQYAALLEVLDEPGSGARADFLGHRLGTVASLGEGLPTRLRNLVTGVMPGLPVAVPVVHDDEPEPSPSDEPARRPAKPTPTPEPPAAPNPEPTPEPAAPAGQPDPVRRDDEIPDGGGDDDDDGDDSDVESDD
jgi:hypothetical protein